MWLHKNEREKKKKKDIVKGEYDDAPTYNLEGKTKRMQETDPEPWHQSATEPSTSRHLVA